VVDVEEQRLGTATIQPSLGKGSFASNVGTRAEWKCDRGRGVAIIDIIRSDVGMRACVLVFRDIELYRNTSSMLD